MANWKRCRAAMTLTARGLDRAEHLWPGLVVNLDRELVPGFTVGAAVAGREAEFEPVSDPSEDYITVDGGPAPADFQTTLVDPRVDLSHARITPIQAKALTTRQEN